MAGLLALALIPHRLLLRSRIVFAAVLTISLLPLVGVAYMMLTMRPVGAEPADYKVWLATGLVVATLLVALLPTSLLLSFLGARKTQRYEMDHAAS